MLGRRPRPKAHKLADSVINEAVQGLLDMQWSPEQISVSLAKRTEAVLISPESIYRGVFNPLNRCVGEGVTYSAVAATQTASW